MSDQSTGQRSPAGAGSDGEPETTGHVWDGIREYNKPLPRWWVWIFYLTIVWGVGYTVAYPAWPGLDSATGGVLGWSSRAELAEELDTADARNEEIEMRLVAADLGEIAGDRELGGFATRSGAAVFRTWCAQCHGAGAAGVQAAGYPNLLDDDWLWGGDIESVYLTIRHGVRHEDDDETRYSEMPAFGDILEEAEIRQVAAHVAALSGGAPSDGALAAAGATVFEDHCASCHGAAGRGDMEIGAPNLADAIWLRGGGEEAIAAMVAAPVHGVMPAWGDRLDEADIRAVAVYVHGLGGGY